MRGIFIRVDFEAIPLDILNRQVGDRRASAIRDTDQFAMLTLGPIQDDTIALARGTAQRHVVRLQLKVTRHHVMAIGDHNRTARPDVACGLEQLLHVGHTNHVTGRGGEGRGLRKPGLHRWRSSSSRRRQEGQQGNQRGNNRAGETHGVLLDAKERGGRRTFFAGRLHRLGRTSQPGRASTALVTVSWHDAH